MKYVLIKPQEGCGICGYIWQTIRGIYHHPDKQYYIDFGDCIYKDYGVNKKNVWDYYFQQPHTQVAPTPNQVEKQVGIIFDEESEFRDVYMKNPTPEHIDQKRKEFGAIIKKYIKPLPEVQNKIDTFAETHFAGQQVLGIHLRGTDHPDKQPMKFYLQKIKNMASNFDKIFVSTDEQSRLDFCKVVFGDKVVSYPSTRSASQQCLHIRPNTSNYHYKIGEDVIIEAFLLSKTAFLLCCPNSNVNYLSRAINPSLLNIALI